MIRIRTLDPGDGATAVALVALQRAAYAVEAELVATDAIPALHETATQLAASGETFLGACDPDLVAAVSYRRTGDTLDVHRLVVHPDAFRRGLASRLLDALESREADATRWLVATAAANTPALVLYAGRGFEPVSEHVVAGGLRIVRLQRDRVGRAAAR